MSDSTDDVKRLSAAIVLDFNMTATYGDVCNPCSHGDTYGALVRLAFHDAFGGGGLFQTGGSNGTFSKRCTGTDSAALAELSARLPVTVTHLLLVFSSRLPECSACLSR